MPLQPDICAFTGKFTSSSEKPIHLREVPRREDFLRNFWLLP
jgi:hypothetical protein